MVIAAFNAEGFIAAAIGSALAQTLAALEVIVIDDRSADATAAVAEEIAARDPRVRVERLSANGGPARARNRGLALARGRFVAILDGDDLWAPDRLERLLGEMKAADADLVADDLVVFDDDGAASPRLLVGLTQPTHITLFRFLAEDVLFGRGISLGHLKPLFRLDRLIALVGGYDEQLGIGEDADLIVRLLRGGAVYLFVPGAGYAYRKHGGSISHRLSIAHAAAMVAGSDRLLAAAQDPDERTALRRRHAAFLRAEAFARLVEAIKDRRWRDAARIAAARPSALPLLRMPVSARLHRSRPRRQPADPRAVEALSAIMGR